MVRGSFTVIIEEVDPKIAANEAATAKACASGNCKSMLATNNLQIRVGSDDNFNEKLGSAPAAKDILEKRTFTCPSTLLPCIRPWEAR